MTRSRLQVSLGAGGGHELTSRGYRGHAGQVWCGVARPQKVDLWCSGLRQIRASVAGSKWQQKGVRARSLTTLPVGGLEPSVDKENINFNTKQQTSKGLTVLKNKRG
ncbi:hypothetical protein PoB_002446600 [Plakobranchus ocellatus]|uniref:Uncharacterized protein n=1 Tax=Plakobranchus ocellatus TaxID=259542 RepID=A0AAV3ZTW8_9GAST|nr:hypothetical protein PoB_002446600 [Plakobranchus ocellatus]